MVYSMAGKPSLMELKRQQWAREREEAKSDFYPWGRPGGGAPLKWPYRTSAHSDSRLAVADPSKTNANYLPPLNWPMGQQSPVSPICPTPAPATAPPRPPSRRSPRLQQQHVIVNHTDGETSGYHSDNHLIDPAHFHRQTHSPSSRSRVAPVTAPPPDESKSDEVSNNISARADYKFLERRKWVQDGTVPPYELYPECLPQIYDARTPPRWVQATPVRPHNATVQTEPIMNGDMNDAISHAQQSAIAAPTFLRGQNVVVDAAVMAEREMKRAKATELQRILLQQLAEKENQKMMERKKIEEEERRQEEELKRQLEMERRQLEEERRRIQEKKEAEERRLEAVKEAIAGAQQNALAEKMARRKAVQNKMQQQQEQHQQEVEVHPVPEIFCTRPITQSQVQSQRVNESYEPPNSSINRLVDAQVQTEQLLKVPCNCSTNPRSRGQDHQRSGAEDMGMERPITQMSMMGLKSQSSNSTPVRPLWNAHQSRAKYQSQTEKDPRFLQRRRERLRRRQKLLLEKQLHGSWPSSENSGSREEMAGEDTFFPFLHGSGTTEKYYEALQAAAVGRYYKKAPTVAIKPTSKAALLHQGQGLAVAEEVRAFPQTPVAPPHSSSREMTMSPPVPALLKKIKMANGEPVSSEKHEWESYEAPDKPFVKIGKDFENLQIKEKRSPCTEQDKQDILFRLSLLKQGLEKKKTALETASIVSSQ